MTKITKITASYIKCHVTNAPHFFDAKTLAFFGQKLSSFKVTKTDNPDIYYLSAPMVDYRCKTMGLTERWFDIRLNKFIKPTIATAI
mgnify:CR=1 FL=1